MEVYYVLNDESWKMNFTDDMKININLNEKQH